MIGGDITDEITPDEETKRGLARLLSHKYANFKRAAQIIAALSKYGFGRLGDTTKRVKELNEDPEMDEGTRQLPQAVRFRLLLESLGPTFIKLGQMLATRPDLIDEAFADELANLRRDVPAEPIEVTRGIIEKELGRPVDELFEDFPDEPLAAASIGMVYKARIRGSGETVAVKVQRPDIVSVIRSDIELLKDMSRVLARAFKSIQRFDPEGAVEEFGIMIVRELDYTLEARNIQRFAKNLADVEAVRVPDLHVDLTTSRVLTMEFVDGVSLDRLDQVEGAPVDGRALVRPLATAFVKMIFVDGYFHADPHHGNLMLDRQGRVVLLDLGAVGYIGGTLKDEVTDFYLALMQGNEEEAALSLVQVCGASLGEVNISRLALDIRDYMDFLELRKAGVQLSKGINQNAVTVLLKNGLHPPSSFVLLERAMLHIQHVVEDLDPTVDYLNVAAENVGMIVRSRMALRRDPMEMLMSARNLAEFMRDLPDRLDRIMRKVETDSVKVKVDLSDMEPLRRTVRRTGLMVSVSLVAFALLLGTAIAGSEWTGPVFGIEFTVTIIVVAWVVAMILVVRWA